MHIAQLLTNDKIFCVLTITILSGFMFYVLDDQRYEHLIFINSIIKQTMNKNSIRKMGFQHMLNSITKLGFERTLNNIRKMGFEHTLNSIRKMGFCVYTQQYYKNGV